MSETPSLIDTLENHYAKLGLAAIVSIMIWMRMQTYNSYFQNGEVYFSGNDAWYHLRSVNYVVRHWPATMSYDVWTGFPEGTFAGQFGTLYDQIIATVALILGFGSPSPRLIADVLLVAPAIAGGLTAIPVYYLGKHLSGRLGGLLAATVLMLLPGTFLTRTLVGVADHNAVEPLVITIAVLGLTLALHKAEKSDAYLGGRT